MPSSENLGGVPLGDHVRLLGDELRALAEQGLRWSTEAPFDRERYEHARTVAAKLFALADARGHEEIEQIVFSQVTHVAPVAVGEGAVVENDRILLIRRRDDGLWAMPGGAFNIGETPAEGAEREVREETGLEVRATELAGVWDSRLCGTISGLHLYMFLFLCERVDPTAPPSLAAHEVIDLGWFTENDLPPLSPGHDIRVPAVFRYRRTRTPHFDPSS